MTAKKKAEAPAEEQVDVHMLHKSFGLEADQKVTVSKSTAERLVKHGHAITSEERAERLETEIRGGFPS